MRGVGTAGPMPAARGKALHRPCDHPQVLSTSGLITGPPGTGGGLILKAYRVKGTFKMGDFNAPFNREIEAKDQKDAREKILSLFGSEHRCKRQYIKVEAIVELTLDEVEDPLIRARVTG